MTGSIAGIVLVLAGLFVLVRNRAVGEFFARNQSDEHRYSLLNRERVERIQAALEDPRTRWIDRGMAIFAGVVLVVMGASMVGSNPFS